MEFIERTLEASSLYMAAELLERKPEMFGYVRIHPEHIARIRAVASRMSLEIEEARLRRDIEGPGTYFLIDPRTISRFQLRDVADLASPSSNGKLPEYSDSVAMSRYLELDLCLDQ